MFTRLLTVSCAALLVTSGCFPTDSDSSGANHTNFPDTLTASPGNLSIRVVKARQASDAGLKLSPLYVSILIANGDGNKSIPLHFALVSIRLKSGIIKMASFNNGTSRTVWVDGQIPVETDQLAGGSVYGPWLLQFDVNTFVDPPVSISYTLPTLGNDNATKKTMGASAEVDVEPCVDCLGTCTYLDRDPAHCGQCGRYSREGAACIDGDFGAEATSEPQTNTISQGITADTTWKSGDTYILTTHIFVSNGATLTIEPGAIIKGEPGSSLVVTREAKLNAVGTAQKPIVFTSAQEDGARKPGDWGGVVLLGKAPINVQGGENSIEGFATTDDSTKFGSLTPDANHDCGKLKYARIEFAGFELVKDNELNGLTVAGCGKKTEIDYVQVHKSADDGVEMLGGTVDLKHIVITQPDDDGFDADFGFSGRVQFLIIQQNADVGNCGFEWDNNNNNKNATPRTMPEIWNATLVGTTREAGGAKRSIGMHLRRGTAGKINNVILANFVDGAIDIDSVESATEFTNGNLFVKNSLLWNNQGNTIGLTSETNNNDGNLDEALELLKPATGNMVKDPMLTDALNLLTPNFLPKAGSPALMGVSPTGKFFDTTATFVGAMGTTDWTAGWTAYPVN